jgi:pyruvate formate lyase activating enzyme
MKALVFDIKRFAVHDGPGIRTTIFFKGCPLSCPWCHNPESRSETIDYYYHTDKVGDNTFTTKRGFGEYYSENDLLHEILKDELFYKESNGGITCSGGEPFFQSRFIKGFLKKCRENDLHTAVDTSGFADHQEVVQAAPFVNLFLFDIKHLDNDIHKHYTGVGNELILKNFDWLINAGYNIIARIPILPEINADRNYIYQLAEHLERRLCPNFNEVHILPYHRIGCSKYDRFKIKVNSHFKEPAKKLVKDVERIFSNKGFNTKIGG